MALIALTYVSCITFTEKDMTIASLRIDKCQQVRPDHERSAGISNIFGYSYCRLAFAMKKIELASFHISEFVSS